MSSQGKFLMCAGAFCLSVLAFYLINGLSPSGSNERGWNQLSATNGDMTGGELYAEVQTSHSRLEHDPRPISTEPELLAPGSALSQSSALTPGSAHPGQLRGNIRDLENNGESVPAHNRDQNRNLQTGSSKIIRNKFIDLPMSGFEQTSGNEIPNGDVAQTILKDPETSADRLADSTSQRSAVSEMPRQVSVMSHNMFSQDEAKPADVDNEPILHAPANHRTMEEPDYHGADRDFRDQAKSRRIELAAAVSQQVNKQIEYGKTLVRRGATYAARDEFVSALRLIAEALDRQTQSRDFSTALASGFTALDEAEDFVNRDSQSHVILHVNRIAANHQTPVLKGETADSFTPQQAMQEYYSFAERQMIEACGGQEVASGAFHALGKSFSLPSELDGNLNTMSVPKAMIMYRIAAAVDQYDYQSRNELAVLLARNGQLEVAKQQLLTSLRIYQSPAAWHNLTMVHDALGEHDFARMAQREYQQSENRLAANPEDGAIRWVTPDQMRDLAPPGDMESRTAQQSSAIPDETPKKGWLKPLKNLF